MVTVAEPLPLVRFTVTEGENATCHDAGAPVAERDGAGESARGQVHAKREVGAERGRPGRQGGGR